VSTLASFYRVMIKAGRGKVLKFGECKWGARIGSKANKEPNLLLPSPAPRSILLGRATIGH
jgi:hypothetical protein